MDSANTLIYLKLNIYRVLYPYFDDALLYDVVSELVLNNKEVSLKAYQLENINTKVKTLFSSAEIHEWHETLSYLDINFGLGIVREEYYCQIKKKLKELLESPHGKQFRIYHDFLQAWLTRSYQEERCKHNLLFEKYSLFISNVRAKNIGPVTEGEYVTNNNEAILSDRFETKLDAISLTCISDLYYKCVNGHPFNMTTIMKYKTSVLDEKRYFCPFCRQPMDRLLYSQPETIESIVNKFLVDEQRQEINMVKLNYLKNN